MAKVLLTVPTQGWVRKEVAGTLVGLFADPRHELNLWFPEFVPLENGQQHVWNKLRGSDYDWWLNIDDDTVPLHNPLDLIDLDLELVGLPEPILREGSLHWSAYNYDFDLAAYKPLNAGEGVQEVSAIGGGCFLLAKRVWMDRKLAIGAFERERGRDGTVARGNDLSFCRRVRDAGWRIWTHWGYPCAHVKELDLGILLGGKDARPKRQESSAGDVAEDHQQERPVSVG